MDRIKFVVAALIAVYLCGVVYCAFTKIEPEQVVEIVPDTIYVVGNDSVFVSRTDTIYISGSLPVKECSDFSINRSSYTCR